MSFLYDSRKQLGRLKCMAIDQWPYLHAMKAIPRQRESLVVLQATLPALPKRREIIYEIHMLCGHRDVDMGIWSSWSILRFLGGHGQLYVHSDGSLTGQDVERWQNVIGDFVAVSRSESDDITARELSSQTKHLYPWRCSNWASAQLVDVHYFGRTPRLLIMDSDVLTFTSPHEVIAALTTPQPGFSWCNDLLDAYSASRDVLLDVTGVQVPRRLCAGFLVCPRLKTFDFIQLDQHMQQISSDPRVALNHFWSCQTYYALLAAGYPTSKPLPSPYSNTSGRTQTNSVLRHYVGIPKVRFRYFTEGLPRILKQAGLLHTIPA